MGQWLMPSEIFARDDETIMRLLQEWPDLLDIMGVTRGREIRKPPGRGSQASNCSKIAAPEPGGQRPG